MVSGLTGGYSSEVDMGRKRVQLLVLLTFVVAVTNCADPNITVTKNTTANTTTSRNATNPASTTTLPPPDPSATEIHTYVLKDPETQMDCFSVSMSISIKANYISADYYIRKAILKIPPTVEVKGACNGVAPTMELIWAEDPTLEGTLNRITLMIARRHMKYSLYVIAYEIFIDGKNFPVALQEGRRFKCELLGLDDFSKSENNGLYGCEPDITANSVDVDITISHIGIGIFLPAESDYPTTEKNGASGADMTQWSGYLLLTAKILIFLKLGHQGI